jgi:hypothetical protein
MEIGGQPMEVKQKSIGQMLRSLLPTEISFWMHANGTTVPLDSRFVPSCKLVYGGVGQNIEL